MTKIYTKLDNKNVAVVETVENRAILNKKVLEDQKKAITETYNAQIAEIDEALAQFTEKQKYSLSNDRTLLLKFSVGTITHNKTKDSEALTITNTQRLA